MLRIQNLTKVYPNQTRALQDVSLDVANNEIVAVVGPSGSGKTTALRTTAGLETPTEGTIQFDSVDVTHLAPQQRKVGMVFQHAALWPHMTVEENIRFAHRPASRWLRWRSQDSDDRHKIEVRELAEQLRIGDLLGRYPRELSGGEQQRAALGRALAHRPRVLLLDEPLSQLDAPLRTSLRRSFRQYLSASNAAVVYVTHDQHEALCLGDRVAVLLDGRIEQIDRPMEVYDHPATLKVARFIGQHAMNLFDAAVTSSEGKQTLVLSACEAAFAAPAGWRNLPGDVVLGVRPEQMTLRPPDAPPQSFVPFPACVTDVERIGDSSLIYLQCGSNEMVVKQTRRAEMKAAVGETLNVYCRPEDVRLFDPSTGHALTTQNPVG